MEQNEKQQGARPQTENPEQITSKDHGRIAGSDHPAALSKDADISAVDQQEGQMNHGETGGNFHETKGNAGGA